jgi:hypothetical protein
LTQHVGTSLNAKKTDGQGASRPGTNQPPPAPTLSRPSLSSATLQNAFASAPLELPSASPSARNNPLSSAAAPRIADAALLATKPAGTGMAPAPSGFTATTPSIDPTLRPAAALPASVASAPPTADALSINSQAATIDLGSTIQLPPSSKTRTTADFSKYSADNYRFFGGLFLPLLQSGTPVDRRHLFMVAPRIASVRDLHFRLTQAVDVLAKRFEAGSLGPAWSTEHSARLLYLHKASAMEGPDAILGEKEDSFRLKVRPASGRSVRTLLSLLTFLSAAAARRHPAARVPAPSQGDGRLHPAVVPDPTGGRQAAVEPPDCLDALQARLGLCPAISWPA